MSRRTPAQEEAQASKAPAIVMEEFHIPSTDAAMTLYVRNKHPAGIKQFAANRILSAGNFLMPAGCLFRT